MLNSLGVDFVIIKDAANKSSKKTKSNNVCASFKSVVPTDDVEVLKTLKD